jgi:outer membrane protein assembly factor BamB
MSNVHRTGRVLVGCLLLLGATCAAAQDWPQWRGPNRDNKVVGFNAPATWPKELTQKWKVTVGTGDAWPVLVGDKVYVFTRQGAEEVISCLNANDGKAVWPEVKYPAPSVSGPASQHPGPRSTPAVAEGKVCTLGVSGLVTCVDAATGKQVWQKDTKARPQFFTASSPLIADGKCVVYVGALTAFDLANGEEKWKWTGEAASYGSPVLMTVDGTKQVVTSSDKSIVGVSLADGKLLWQVPFGQTAYQNHSGTPIIDGQTVIYSGQTGGTVALKIEKKGDTFDFKELWKQKQGSGMYNTPVLKDGLLFGLITANRAPSNLFCMEAKTGEVLWKDTTPRGECGEVFDAGSVLLALTSNSELLVFKPSNKGYEELAKYKVSDKGANTGTDGTWAGPIISGNRVFVKDKDSLALWTIN